MLERGWREPLMGLAEKRLLMRRISVNFEVSHARISTIMVTSRMRTAEMTYLVRKEAYVWGQDPFKGNNAWDLDEKLLAPCLSGLKIKHLSKVHISSSGSFPKLCYMCSFHISVVDRTCPLWNAVPTSMRCESLWGMEPLFAPGFWRWNSMPFLMVEGSLHSSVDTTNRGCYPLGTRVHFSLLLRDRLSLMYLQRAMVLFWVVTVVGED